MECNIIRVKTTGKNCHFKIPADPHWEVIGKRIHGIRRCHFSVYQDGVLQYVLAQPSLLKQWIPLYENPFYFFRDGVRCGGWRNKSKLGQYIYELEFYENVYTLAWHSNGIYSLLKNEVQVGLYRWIDFGKYHMKYSPVMEEQHDIIILFAALVENYWTLDRKFGDPTAFYILDRVKERIHWLPEDEAEK